MRFSTLLTVLFIFGLSTTAYSQSAKIEGQVLNDKNRPVSGVRVSALGGQSTVTDGRGHFRITFPASIQPGQVTRIQVAKPGWVIYQPIFGEWVTQSAQTNNVELQVVIVPAGSPLALSPAQLSRLMTILAERSRSGAGGSLKQDLSKDVFFIQYAERYGVTLAQLHDALIQWSQTKDSADKAESARKEYWLGNYAEAARLAEESAKETDKQSVKSLNAAIEAYRALIERYGQGQSPPERASAQNDLCAALLKLGHRTSGPARVNNLNEAVTACRSALLVYSREQSPQEWARAQHNLGLALKALKEGSLEIQ